MKNIPIVSLCLVLQEPFIIHYGSVIDKKNPLDTKTMEKIGLKTHF